MIFVDHCTGNVFSYGTLLHLQFSDASEMFFLLSGFSSMAAYGGLLDRGDWRGAARHIAQRCCAMYATQLAMLLAAGCVMAGWSHAGPLDIDGLQALPGTSERFVGIAQSQLFQLDWRTHLLDFMLMRGLPGYFDILRSYIVLLASFPLMWWGLRRAPRVTFAISAAIWLAAHGAGGLHFYDVVKAAPWDFNPFGWQFVFLCGAGVRVLTEREPNLRYTRVAAGLSLGVVAAGLAFHLAPWLGVTPEIPMMGKVNLSPVRLLNTLALVYLLLCFDWPRPALHLPPTQALRACGRHSLLVFSIGILMSLNVDLAFSRFGQGLAVQVVATAAGVAVLLGAAALADRRRKRQRRLLGTTSYITALPG